MRIYIATWGDPKNWRYAEYYYNGCSAKGFSALNLVLASEKLKPDLALIFTPDTLAREAVREVTNKDRFDRFKDYRSLLSNVKEYIKKYLCAEGNIIVEVLPGVMGGGGKETGFRGNLNDTRLLALYHIYFYSIQKTLNSKDCSLEILLDTSQGINYLITLVSEVVREASAALSAALLKPVILRVFNADPIPSGLSPTRSSTDKCTPEQQSAIFVPTIPTLQYNLLREETIEPWDLVKYLRYKEDKVNNILSHENSCDINHEEKESVLKVAKRIVAAFRVGALAELITIVSSDNNWADRAIKLIENAKECWLDRAKVLVKGETFKTEFSAELTEGFRLLIHAHAIYTGVKKSLNNCTTDPSQIPLRCIKDLASSLIKGSEVTKTLILHEIEIRLENKKDKIPNVWTPYEKILGLGRGVTPERDRLKRNFIAHAGLLIYILEVRRENDEIFIRIREDCKELVDKVLDKVFEDLLIPSKESLQKNQQTAPKTNHP